MKVQKIAVIVVHGLGLQKKEYAEKFMKKLDKTFSDIMQVPSARPYIEVEPVYWADVFGKEEERIYQELVLSKKLRYKFLRRYLIYYLADAVAYQPVDTNGHNYDAVHQAISNALHSLSQRAGKKAPLCVVSHSLGSVIASNFFYDLQYKSRHFPGVIDTTSPLERGDTLTHFYSLGTTLPLWSLRYRDFSKPIVVPSREGQEIYPGLQGEWVNFFDKDDILGYPLRNIDPAYEKAVKQDIDTNVGNPLSFWNPFCHSGYMKSRKVVRHISEKLAETYTFINQGQDSRKRSSLTIGQKKK
ncbi:chemotaxis protein [Paenibacillus sp. FSL H7-0326]|uniref:chemotaxis protein n=1 Tax=Paenibacillus sp. FSL H7-0326 TaxID=1921144 RepID=UPI00269C247F|nr:chemotaxis protein [Paenibacillus sp. FSL H7-0326]